MRRSLVVAAVLVISVLVATAPPAAAANVSGDLAVASKHSSDTEFQNASKLTNVTVEGSGAAASVVLNTGKDIEIGYEDSADSNFHYVDDAGNNVDTGQSVELLGGMADVDGDGDIDQIFRDSSNNVKIVDDSGNVQDLNVDASAVGGAGDADGDGDVDVAYRDTSDNLKFVDDSGNTIDTGVQANDVGDVGDVDGDGDDDIAYRDNSDDSIEFVDDDGNNVDTGADGFIVGGIGDFTGDGDVEIVYRDTSDNLKYVDESGNVGDTGVDTSGFLSDDLADFNGDGDLELAFEDSGNLKVTDSSGNTADTGQDTTRVGGMADFDGDGGAPPSGRYISQNHTAEDITEGFANLTLQNAYATVEWRTDTDDDGTFETVVNSSTYSSGGNKTIDLDSSEDTWRVNVTFKDDSGSTTAELHDEGLLFDASAPSGSDADPTGQVNSYDGDIELDVDDTDFGLAQGDNVTVTAKNASGGQINQTSITSNQTVSFKHNALAGENDITWTLEDSYGNTETITQNFSTPATLFIRNASDTSELVKGPDTEVTVSFFGSDDTVIQRSTTNGTISLDGVPMAPDGGYQINVENGDEYQPRQAVIRDLFEQQSVYLLPTNTTQTTVEFQLTDRTGRFQQPRLNIEKPITKDFDGDGTNETEYRTLISNEFSAAQSLTVTIERGVRYRLEIVNENGERRVLGSYTPRTATDVQTLTIAKIQLAPEPGESGVAVEAGIREPKPNSHVVRVLVSDANNATTDIEYDVIRTDTSPNQTVATFDDPGPLGRSVATYPINASPDNATYVVDYEYSRGGETVTGQIRLGNISPWGTGYIDDTVASLVAWVTLAAFGGLTVIRAPRIGAVSVVILATLFSTLGFFSIGPVPLGIAGATAVLFVISRGAGQ